MPLSKSWEKGKAGQLGMVQFDVYGIRVTGVERWGPDSLATNEEAIAGAEVVIVPPLTGPDGTGGGRIYSPVAPFAYKLHVSSKVDDGKLERILQIVDYARATDDPQVWMKSVYGKEGVHYTWYDEPWNSTAVRTPEDSVPDGYSGLGMFPWHRPGFRPLGMFKYLYHPELADFWANWIVNGAGSKYATRPYRYDIAKETDLRDVKRKYGATITTIGRELMLTAKT